MTGWIKIYRDICNWRFYKDTNTKALFLHILLNADYTGCSSGCLSATLRQLSADTGLSVQNIRTSLKKLSESEITISIENGKTLIKINSWEKYQASGKTVETNITEYIKRLEQYRSDTGTEPNNDTRKLIAYEARKITKTD